MSWGRYWGWDPKETWALITMLVYALLLHFPWLKAKSKISNHKFEICYHVFSVIAFLFVLFTYFGVSYLLGGLPHQQAANEESTLLKGEKLNKQSP